MKGRSECDALSLSWKKEIGLTRAKFVGEAISNGLSMGVWLEKKKNLVEETKISGWKLKGDSGKTLETWEEGELRKARVAKGRSQAW